MAVILEIEDGTPWYLSPNLWVVPGEDPEGPAGVPVAGQPCYLWARVRNTGSHDAINATVRYYWANPSVGVSRTTATLVGTSNVTLAGGDTTDVLCLTPWVPTFVNNGHECIVGEAFLNGGDPLPATVDFNVPTDRHVAQRNLAVAMAAKKRFHFAFEAHNGSRKEGAFNLRTRMGRLDEVEAILPLLGRKIEIPRELGGAQRLMFIESPCPQENATGPSADNMPLRLRPHERKGFSLVGELEGDATLIHVTQEIQGRVVGGLAVLVVAAKHGKQEAAQ